MSYRPIYIFDLDGTLADIQHRLPILADKTDRGRWDKFYRACENDTPIYPVISTMYALKRAHAVVYIMTGRSEAVRTPTVEWLQQYTSFSPIKDTLFMRPEHDHRRDDVLKEEWLHGLSAALRHRITAAFEDRSRVVEMWRRNGVQCFQVAPGDF